MALQPTDLNALLAQLMQQQREMQAKQFAALKPGPAQAGAGLGRALRGIFGGGQDMTQHPEYQAQKAWNDKITSERSTIDFTDPTALIQRSKELASSTNVDDQRISSMMFDRGMELIKLDAEQRRLLAQAAREEIGAEVEGRTAEDEIRQARAEADEAEVAARVATATEDAQITRIRNDARASGFKADIDEINRDYLDNSYASRLEQEYLSTDKLRQELINMGLDEDLLFRKLQEPMRQTQLGQLISEQDKLVAERAALDPEKHKVTYDKLSANIKDYQNRIKTLSLGLQRSIDGTELTKGNATRIQMRLQGWESMSRSLTKLRDLIQNPGNSVGEIPRIRENLSGRLGSAFTEVFGEEVGRVISEGIASDDTVKVRTAAELVVTQFAQQIHQYEGRYTKTAEDAAQRILHTLEATTDERAALDAILTVMDYVEESYQMDLTALLNAQIGAEDALEVMKDPVLDALMNPDNWEENQQ